MTLGGKRGNPKQDFPSSHPAWKSLRDSHIPPARLWVYTRSGDQLHPTNCHPCPRAKVLPMSPAHRIERKVWASAPAAARKSPVAKALDSDVCAARLKPVP